MKDGLEAQAQYSELVTALRELRMDWIINEVNDEVLLGKAVAFRDLDQDELIQYEARYEAESQKGRHVSRARAADEVRVAYNPSEVLDLTVQAIDRVVTTAARSQAEIAGFASRHSLRAIAFEQPREAETAPVDIIRDEISTDVDSDDLVEQSARLSEFLRRDVLG